MYLLTLILREVILLVTVRKCYIILFLTVRKCGAYFKRLIGHWTTRTKFVFPIVCFAIYYGVLSHGQGTAIQPSYFLKGCYVHSVDFSLLCSCLSCPSSELVRYIPCSLIHMPVSLHLPFFLLFRPVPHLIVLRRNNTFLQGRVVGPTFNPSPLPGLGLAVTVDYLLNPHPHQLFQVE